MGEPDPKIDFFDVVTRTRPPVPEGVPQGAVPWSPWTVHASRLSPREAKGRLIQHAARCLARDYAVVSLSRAEITLEDPYGARLVVRMRKEA